MNTRQIGLLSSVHVGVLLALSLKPRHGYELMKQVKTDSAARLAPGPGILYASLKQLERDNYIEEMPFEGSPRRRYYRLTKKGLNRLEIELQYYRRILSLATERHLETN
ncbi:MAG TPA: PadR family transcriptional regulator [Candidatus Saccharimonadales bacterium]|nr:PadR family transcriptional regulator [Candidatus Saccharimonadales bacterium]